MLSKSDFMAYYRCPCELWLKKVRPDLLPPPSVELQHRFDEGNKIDQEAWKLFPDGLHVTGFVFDGWRDTQKALKSGKDELFQPTAVAGQYHSRADLLTRNRSAGGWDIREVKSATKVKEEYFVDLAFQKICFTDAGVTIGKTWLIHINNRYIRRGDIDPRKLLVAEDITDEVRALVPWVRKEMPRALAVTAWGKKPMQRNVDACTDPENCEFLGYYLDELPDDLREALHERRDEPAPVDPPVIRVDVAAVKRAIGFHAAETLTPEAGYQLIEKAAQKAVEDRAADEAFRIPGPVTVDLMFHFYQPAELLSWLPNVQRTGARSIRFTSDNMVEATKFLAFMASYNFSLQP